MKRDPRCKHALAVCAILWSPVYLVVLATWVGL